MSGLTIFSDTAPQQPLWQSRDAQEIQRQLAQIGVRFERWQADRELGDNPQPEVVIAAYQHEIDRLVAEKGYQSWDVISMRRTMSSARRCVKIPVRTYARRR